MVTVGIPSLSALKLPTVSSLSISRSFPAFFFDQIFILLHLNLLYFSSKAPPVVEKREPCNPSPCGANAECKERSGAGSCTCLPEYYGDPYTGCRPECVQNSDCDRSKACVQNKCQDPCPGVCGINAECRVQNHAPICLCLIGYEGDPTRSCSLKEIGELIFFTFTR